ncbi:MAG: hypothetical protein JWM47_3738 [Acidimicrobiales bacterium]|nr:hypothetical protein [Acidimicrobiales bacterium]
MPEAPVDEDRDPCTSEKYVDSPPTANHCDVHYVPQATMVQFSSENHLR